MNSTWMDLMLTLLSWIVYWVLLSLKYLNGFLSLILTQENQDECRKIKFQWYVWRLKKSNWENWQLFCHTKKELIPNLKFFKSCCISSFLRQQFFILEDILQITVLSLTVEIAFSQTVCSKFGLHFSNSRIETVSLLKLLFLSIYHHANTSQTKIKWII